MVIWAQNKGGNKADCEERGSHGAEVGRSKLTRDMLDDGAQGQPRGLTLDGLQTRAAAVSVGMRRTGLASLGEMALQGQYCSSLGEKARR